jgi:hypothetical protein
MLVLFMETTLFHIKIGPVSFPNASQGNNGFVFVRSRIPIDALGLTNRTAVESMTETNQIIFFCTMFSVVLSLFREKYHCTFLVKAIRRA